MIVQVIIQFDFSLPTESYFFLSLIILYITGKYHHLKDTQNLIPFLNFLLTDVT